ncbi:MAG: hypothetical protein ABI554_02315 [Flavobacterium sp.]
MENFMIENVSSNISPVEMMSWIQFGIFFIGVFGLFIWNRTESRTDIRHVESILISQRSLIDAIRQDNLDFRKEWMQESKNFHNRLIAIEERNKK